MKIKSTVTIFCIAVLALLLSGPGCLFAEEGGVPDPHPVADLSMGSNVITWQPKVEYAQMLLTVSGPSGAIFSRTFEGSNAPNFALSDMVGLPSLDGVYSYELRVIPILNTKAREQVELRNPISSIEKALTQSGSFMVRGGSIVNNIMSEGPSSTKDVLHYDDVIITGSLCIGFDCINGESFGYDTLKLKENNLRLYFEDTSIGTFPTGDWRIKINDTTSGGASYFAIEDATNARTPFRIETGAPNHSIYVEDYGRVGLGTSIPYVELHIVDGDSPTVRLDQDGSSGWAAQKWDLCGNETNFFLRDVTNGSKLCFRVQPNTPSNTLCMRSTGNVGIGTWSPEYSLEIEKTGQDAVFVAQRTDGASAYMTGSASYAFFGSVNTQPLRIVVNGSYKMQINSDGTLDMSDGGGYDGTWNPASSREIKENIHNLETQEAIEAVESLTPVKYNYKKNKEEDRVGFIAEDVPQLVATNSRKNLSTMDIVAVLTKVVQEQQKTIKEMKQRLEKIEKIQQKK